MIKNIKNFILVEKFHSNDEESPSQKLNLPQKDEDRPIQPISFLQDQRPTFFLVNL